MAMFGTPKPTASLSSGLLARKGHARPAMRPQGFVSLTPHSSEDLGWNDMGEDSFHPAPQPVPAPVAIAVPPAPPPVLQQREMLEEQLAPEAPAPAPLPPRAVARVVREVKAATTNNSKAAFTLRLDTDRHLRLRLASAVHNRSAQQLVTEALDAFLESLTDVDALATQLSQRKSRG
ncbi:MAG: hypothetical protein V4574_16920 [Pseudomonadota bacterium]